MKRRQKARGNSKNLGAGNEYRILDARAGFFFRQSAIEKRLRRLKWVGILAILVLLPGVVAHRRGPAAFKEAAKARSAALTVTPDPLVTSNFKLVYRFIETYLLAMSSVILTAWLENRLVPN